MNKKNESYWVRRVRRSPLSRRKFVQGAGLTGLGLAGMSLVGCGDDDKENMTPTSVPSREGTADASPPPRRGGILSLAHYSEPPTFDPSATAVIGTQALLPPLYSRLLRTVWPPEAKSSRDLTIKGDLVESWERVDEQTYSFTLRPNARWHDISPVSGRAVDAEDIVASIERFKAGGPQAAAFKRIEKATAVGRTITMHLSAPFAFLEQTLAGTIAHMMPREMLAADAKLDSTPIVGSGPFMFKGFTRGDSFEAVRNPNYYVDGLPYLDGIRWPFITDPAAQAAAFRAGNIHWIDPGNQTNAKQIADSVKGVNIANMPPTYAGQGIVPNARKKPFDNPLVRRAISMAIDRSAILAGLAGKDNGITGWFFPWIFAQDSPWSETQLGPYYQYDPTEAKKLLSAAGYGNGLSAKLIYFPYTPFLEETLQLSQAQLKANLGIDFQLTPLQYTDYIRSVTSAKDYEVGAVPFPGTNASVPEFFYTVVHSQGGQNYQFTVVDTALDSLAEQLIREIDESKRSELMKKMLAVDTDQIYRVPLPGANVVQLGRPELHGWTPPIEFRTLGYGNAQTAMMWLS